MRATLTPTLGPGPSKKAGKKGRMGPKYVVCTDSMLFMLMRVLHVGKRLTRCHEHNSGQSPNVLVGPGVKSRVQLAAIDCHSVACVLEGPKREVTREGPTNPRVSTKSGVSGVFLEWI